MERRDLLKLSGWLSLAAAGGAWTLTRASDGADAPLDRALAQARRNGKPVLVLIAPPPPVGIAEVGEAFVDALDSGGDDLLVDLLLCELACATPAQLAQIAGAAASPNEVGVLEFDGGSVGWRRIPFDATPFSVRREDPQARNARNVETLRAALCGDDALLARRAEAARAALGDARLSALEAQLARGAQLDADESVQAAAWLRTHPNWEAHKPAALVVARAHLLDHPPRGARWAESSGCASVDVTPLSSDDRGVRYDLALRASGETPAFRLWPGRPIPNPFRGAGPSSRALCGMAFGGAHSNRFLFFYIDGP